MYDNICIFLLLPVAIFNHASNWGIELYFKLDY